MNRSTRKKNKLSTLIALVVLSAAFVACNNGTDAESETHFLGTCRGACGGGMSCVCGVCTKACGADGMCAELASAATCTAPPASCGSAIARACDVMCAERADCAALGNAYECLAGRCRHVQASVPSRDAGTAGADAGGGSDGGGGLEAAVGDDQGATRGDGRTSDAVGGAKGCDKEGARCCDPFPRDGPNYCNAGLLCDVGNTCADCDCLRGGLVAVCGTDGETYDASCGRVCVPVPIACDHACPCEQCLPRLSTGCASSAPGGGSPCCDDLVCCEGVPYPALGQCQPDCPLLSDRNLKTDIHPADTEALLESVARLPIHVWRYRARPQASHVGPMAQDFANELGLGESDRVIAPVDANGVTLGAIQALYRRVENLSAQNDTLRRRIGELEAHLDIRCR